MAIQKGDRVLVNLAPFVGSARRSKESVSCRVLAIDATQVEVVTEYPCREFSLWVQPAWIERRLADDQDPPAGGFRKPQSARERPMMAG